MAGVLPDSTLTGDVNGNLDNGFSNSKSVACFVYSVAGIDALACKKRHPEFCRQKKLKYSYLTVKFIAPVNRKKTNTIASKPRSKTVDNSANYTFCGFSLRIGIIFNNCNEYRSGSLFHVCSSRVQNVKGENNGFNKKHEC